MRAAHWFPACYSVSTFVSSIVFVANIIALRRNGGKVSRNFMLFTSETIVLYNLPEFAALNALTFALILVLIISAIITKFHKGDRQQISLPTYLQSFSLVLMALSFTLYYGLQYSHYQRGTGYLLWYISMSVMSCGLIMGDIYQYISSQKQHGLEEKNILFSYMLIYTFGLVYSLARMIDYISSKFIMDSSSSAIHEQYEIHDGVLQK